MKSIWLNDFNWRTAAPQQTNFHFILNCSLRMGNSIEMKLFERFAAPAIIQKFYFWFDGRLLNGKDWKSLKWSKLVGCVVWIGGVMGGGTANGSAQESKHNNNQPIQKRVKWNQWNEGNSLSSNNWRLVEEKNAANGIDERNGKPSSPAARQANISFNSSLFMKEKNGWNGGERLAGGNWLAAGKLSAGLAGGSLRE